MRSRISEMLGVDLPLFAFSHCRDVVAAVTNAGGFGVLGVSSSSPSELEQELSWIDDQVSGRPYGVDLICPENLAGMEKGDAAADLADLVPSEHRQHVVDVLARHDLSLEQIGEDPFRPFGDLSEAGGRDLLAVAMRHPIRLIANALGVPPPFMIDHAKQAGIPVAALVGSRQQALRQVEAGVDLVIAQGTEAGGHCGDVTTMVLVPEVVDAVRAVRDIPVLAAGGIVTGRQMAAAMALGADGVWTGSVWLTTEEAETAPYTVQRLLAAGSRDTVRSKGRTGKYSRQLRSGWTDAWNGGDGAPEPLPMPLQSVISEHVLRRVDTLAERGHAGAQELATYWVGQGVGLMDRVRPAREVVRRMAEEYVETVTGLAAGLE